MLLHLSDSLLLCCSLELIEKDALWELFIIFQKNVSNETLSVLRNVPGS